MIEKEMQALQKACGTRVIVDGKSTITNIPNKAFYDKCLIYSETKSKQIKGSLKWNPMSEDWKSCCKERSFWGQDTLKKMKQMHPQMDDRLFELRTKLLEFAGEAVCLPAYEEDLDNILSYGQFWLGNNVKHMKGEPSHCHSNTSNLWEQNKDITNICTGYALSDDGLWRQHSWLIWHKARSNQIVETTTSRIAYYGFVMSYDMCEDFAYNNYG